MGGEDSDWGRGRVWGDSAGNIDLRVYSITVTVGSLNYHIYLCRGTHCTVAFQNTVES